MITRQELDEAIRQYSENPTAQSCVTLAAFYTIRDHLYPEKVQYAEQSGYSSDTEFGEMVGRIGTDALLPIMDELMETLRVLNPPLYAGVMQKIGDA